MTIHLASDHAGWKLKEAVKALLVTELTHEVVDHGAARYDETDDFPLCIAPAARAVAAAPTTARAIIFGGSGQGEAMVANRFPGVRATVFYGEPAGATADADGDVLSIIAASRRHNDANVLSIGARYVSETTAVAAVKQWLATDFSGDSRHVRRIEQIEAL